MIIMLSDINDEPFAKSEQRRPFSEHTDMHGGPWKVPDKLFPEP